MKGFEAPLTIQFQYLNNHNKNADLKVYLSQKHTEPSSTMNEGAYTTPKKIMVMGEKGSAWFQHTNVYMTISSVQGCTIRVTPVF